jgi:ubiquinone/menaquinone biosynthesis C-methylase UbiE
LEDVLDWAMPDYRKIYEEDAEAYQRLVAAEDADGELPRAIAHTLGLARIEPRGSRVVEVGMGTGRVTRILVDAGANVTGYERSSAMLAVARRLLGTSFRGVQADVRHVELPASVADVALAGWCLGHFCEWYGERWPVEIDAVLHKMWHALDAGGVLIIIETLGTGSPLPRAPNASLAAYYALLEGTWQMQRQEFRTDYRFDSAEAACASLAFFFGPELADRVREQGSGSVPEWTGLWWRQKAERSQEP